MHTFLSHCDYDLENWEILNTIYKGVNRETCALLEYWLFCDGNVDEAWDFLECWLKILMNLRLVMLIHTSDPLASLIMLLLCVKFVIVLIMEVILIHVIFLMRVLLDLAV